MAVVPMSYLPPESQQWGRSVDERIGNLETLISRSLQQTNNTLAQLNSSINLLSLQVTQLNNASESLSSSTLYLPGGSPDSQQARTDFDASLVSFSRPSWATGGTIIATATFSGSDTPTSGYNVTMWCRINNVNNSTSGTAIGVPNDLEIRNAGVLQPEIAYDTTPAPTTIVFAQTFSTTEASVSASCRITKGFSGGASSYNTSVAATVFWTAQ